MIKLSFEEGYGYDILAIADVKHLKNPENSLTLSNYLWRLSELSDVIGEDLHLQIMNSTEYAELVGVNLELYELIDKNKILKKMGQPILDADPLNYERFLWKEKLQKRFFLNSFCKIVEQKFGYDKD